MQGNFFSLAPSDRIDLPEAKTTRRYDRAFFLTYESLPRSVSDLLTCCLTQLPPFCLRTCYKVRDQRRILSNNIEGGDPSIACCRILALLVALLSAYMLSHPIAPFCLRACYKVRDQRRILSNDIKGGDPSIACCRIPALLVDLLSAYLLSHPIASSACMLVS